MKLQEKIHISGKFYLDDDLDISSALAAIFRTVKRVNRLATAKALDRDGAQRILKGFKGIDDVLGIFKIQESSSDPVAEELIRQRDDARAKKDWSRADEIRNKLASMGIEVRDRKA